LSIENFGTVEYGLTGNPDANFEFMRDLYRIIADGGRAIFTFPFSEKILLRKTQTQRDDILKNICKGYLRVASF